MPRSPTFCIYGAGAIGGTIAAKLAQAGATVSIVARGSSLLALKREGLRLTMGGTTLAVPVQATDDPRELGPQDYIIVAVKAPALPDVARGIAPLLRADTAVITAMNGIPWWFFQSPHLSLVGQQLAAADPTGAIARAIPPHHAIGCVVHMSCSLEGPGHARHNFARRLIIGEADNRSTRRIAVLADWLRKAEFDCHVSTLIQRDIWSKLWLNMTMNPISLLTEATCDRIIDDPLIRNLARRMMEEAAEVGRSIGITLDRLPEQLISDTRSMGCFKTSMLQDLEQRRPVEIDALLSATREIGQIAGISTPFIDSVLGLARVRAAGLGLMDQAA